LDSETTREEALTEACDRIRSFCEELKAIDLKFIHEDSRLSISEKGVRSAFVMDAHIDCNRSSVCSNVRIRLESFSSSAEGVEKIRNIQRQVNKLTMQISI